jgi:hypothetical protein
MLVPDRGEPTMKIGPLFWLVEDSGMTLLFPLDKKVQVTPVSMAAIDSIG